MKDFEKIVSDWKGAKTMKELYEKFGEQRMEVMMLCSPGDAKQAQHEALGLLLDRAIMRMKLLFHTLGITGDICYFGTTSGDIIVRPGSHRKTCPKKMKTKDSDIYIPVYGDHGRTMFDFFCDCVGAARLILGDTEFQKQIARFPL
jgi:hypothetical protein